MPWDLLEISEFQLQEWVVVVFLFFVLFLMPLSVVCTLSTQSQSNWNIERSVGSGFNPLPPGVAIVTADTLALFAIAKAERCI